MIINGKDALHLKKYDYKVLKQIYEQGTKQVMLDKSILSDNELALITSAGHAIDLVDISNSKAAKNTKAKLDFCQNGPENLCKAATLFCISSLMEGIPEREIRNSIAKKVSSYILFEMWNVFNNDKNNYDLEFDLSMRFDLLQGCNTVSRQRICAVSLNDNKAPKYFDALSLGRAFASEDIHIIDPDKKLVAIDMPSYAKKVAEDLQKMI